MLGAHLRSTERTLNASTAHTLNVTPPNVGRLDEILSSDPRLSWFINGVPVGLRV